ncbi:MAG: xanthine dehydrogenase family protein subunit M [Spirochaetes bacterium]|nr:xanthine dehydrogenase family protein subunit M [Spirochaetota bacterium]
MRPVFLPSSMGELWTIMEENPRASLFAGGTDLLVRLRRGTADPPSLICLERIPELQGVTLAGSTVTIGACATFAEMLKEPAAAAVPPVLARAVREIGSPLIRAMGTIGGNICNASPAGDSLPPLHVLDAELDLVSARDRRCVKIGDFITGPGGTCLRPGEVLASVRFKLPEGPVIQHFEKVGARRALACSIVSMAALVRLSGNGVIEGAALAWGGTGPVIIRCGAAESILAGKRLTEETLSAAAGTAREAVMPIDDLRGGAAYRRKVAGNLLMRLLEYA